MVFMPPFVADLEAFMPDYSCQAFIEIKLQELGIRINFQGDCQ